MKSQINILRQTKNLTPLLAVAFCCMLGACESHEQKADAFDRYKASMAKEKDTVIIVKEIKQPAKKPRVVIVNECQSEWLNYRNEVEKKIKDNGSKIAILLDGPANAKTDKALKRLQEKNNDLHIKLDEFNDDINRKLEKFKASIDHEINEIGSELQSVN